MRHLDLRLDEIGLVVLGLFKLRRNVRHSYGIHFYFNRDNNQSLTRVVWRSREFFLEGDLRGRHKTI